MLDVNNFDSMRIGLASPDKIREWSYGEVTKPETINYRTLKPETSGLFCERIFGPTRDWECHCGKYKRIRHKGTVCERCGVEVTRAKVRRERMGHIELAAPVSHIWYFKGIPSRLGLVLDIAPRALEKVLYFASYIVIDPGTTELSKKQLLSEKEYSDLRSRYSPTAFRVGMGAEAIKELLVEIESDLPEEEQKPEEGIFTRLDLLHQELAEELKTVTSQQRRLKAIRRLEVVEAFRKSGNKPSWMIMDVVPVIPPELRPMVQLDGGRFATSDLNDLYRRVINRNNRLKRLLELHAPDIIVRNEKRMLQEAVDALIDNGRRGRPVTGPGNRPLKSLSDMLKGKQGRFRQNLLGKRVDYSGRSVIVVGPELKLHQCGLPKEMALELFKPFVMKRLVSDGIAHNIKSAKRMVERAKDEVWDVLEGVIKEHPVLLNRAPTLHRLGIQAFEPVLTEGRALKLHPLACTAYNADFDGDQMAIHLPLSAEAQAEARVLMLAANHILAPKDGGPIIVPSQDMVLGSYYLTAVRDSSQGRPVMGEGKIFTGINEALLAYQHQELDLQAEIKVRIKETDEDGNVTDYGLVRTTLGRMIFNETLPKAVRQYTQDKKTGEWSLGKLMKKGELGKLVDKCFKTLGASETAVVIDNVKNLGYHYACIAGMTVAISDIKVPEKKQALLDEAEAMVKKTQRQFDRGLMSEEERYKRVCKIWNKTTEQVADAMYDNYEDNEPFNPIYMMANSGARGNKSQMRQLAGMRGLMADPSGKTIEIPITANFREGLSVSDYFISSHGARKGLADTALRTADSGYLTRRLVDVAQDVIVREEDCDVVGINLVRERAKLADSAAAAIESLKDSLIGRIMAADVVSPETGEVIISKGDVIDEEYLKSIGEAGVSEIVLSGSASNSEADISNAAATDTVQLGAPDENIRKSIKAAMVAQMMGKDTTDAVIDSNGVEIVPAGVPLTEEYIEAVLSSDAKEVKVRNNNIRGIEVEAIAGEVKGSKDILPLKARILGRVLAEDIIDPKSGKKIASINDDIDEELAEEISKIRTKVSVRSVLTCKSQYGVCIKCYGRDLANATRVNVGEAVGIIAAQSIGEPGTQLTMRTFHSGGIASGEDITQGLPRVEELFEARKPKHMATIAEIEGDVTVTAVTTENGTLSTVTITPNEAKDKAKEYVLPVNARVAVKDGDHVLPGDKITEGSINPHDILRVCGLKATQNYLVYEVQKVYQQQGVGINDKHIEVMVRQMLHKVRIEAYGDTDFLPGEYVDINSFEAANTKAIAEGKEPAVAKPILLGITKAALATDSFLSAASFQETTRVLTDAAIKGKVDPLLGLKENVIIGKLIPAGTGMSCYRNIKVVYEDEPEQTVEAEAAAE